MEDDSDVTFPSPSKTCDVDTAGTSCVSFPQDDSALDTTAYQSIDMENSLRSLDGSTMENETLQESLGMLIHACWITRCNYICNINIVSSKLKNQISIFIFGQSNTPADADLVHVSVVHAFLQDYYTECVVLLATKASIPGYSY